MSTAPQTPAPPPSLRERRLAAFCSPGVEVFHSVVHQSQVWRPDPFDVEDIHAEARDCFQRLLARASGSPAPEYGKLLVIQGEAGSGKTHLMRAFRRYTHEDGCGYFGYLQMTAQASHYAHYILASLIDALDQPYCPPAVETTGLMRLSGALFERLPPDDREAFRDEEGPAVARRAFRSADRIIADPRFNGCEVDLIRALLLLQHDDPGVRRAVHSWLRCEDLTPYDREAVGHLMPRTREEDPLRMIVDLGNLMAVVREEPAPLVVCIDQLEDIPPQDSPTWFRQMVATLVAVAGRVPTAVLVLSCLEDFYAAYRQHLTAPQVDRIERDPEPIRLTGGRTPDEIRALIARRVDHLFERANLEPDGECPTFPFTPEHLARLTNTRTRDVLSFCQQHHNRCQLAGRWTDPIEPPPPSSPPPHLEQLWNEFQRSHRDSVPTDECDLAALFAWAVETCSAEMPEDHWFSTAVNGTTIPTEAHRPGNAVDRLFLALCERSARGGGLGRQIAEVEEVAGATPIVLLRSTDYPKSPTAAVNRVIGQIVARGGRRVVVEDADWRRMLAFRAFRTAHQQEAGFGTWVRESCPLSELPSLREALDLENLADMPAFEDTPPPPAPPATPQKVAPPSVAVPPVESGSLFLGTGRGVTGAPVHVDPQELRQHLAVLGGSGSGKTTAALALVEQLLLRGTPVVLVDRKGDLCNYADPAAWERPLGDPQAEARRQRLRERVEVAVFTPGRPDGRPLTIPLMPEDTEGLSPFEREQMAGHAAAALASMIGYRTRGTDQTLRVILQKAIEVLAATARAPVTIPAVRQLIEDQDDALLAAVGRSFDRKLYNKLGVDLQTLWLQHRALLGGEGERLDIDALLGRGGHAAPGKTRLSIISTHFLEDSGTLDFWVAQLLVTIDRWRTKAPSDQLQAVFLFDEADQYLPAQRQPASKAPMEGLLKRLRSAGGGIVLATQSPGDLDYKCRDNINTWLVGRVKETTALGKLKPMFGDGKGNALDKLPDQKTGEFYLVRAKDVTALTTCPSLIKTDQLPEDRILELAHAGRRA